MHDEDQLADMMCMALGGRGAEEVVFNVVSTGAQNDLERVTQMAHAQVAVYGMSSSVGPLSFRSTEENGTLYRPYSEQTAQLIDTEVQSIINGAYDRTLDILRKHRPQLDALAEALLEKEVIDSDDLIANNIRCSPKERSSKRSRS